MNPPVFKAPKAFTAQSRLVRLQVITQENQRLLKAIQSASTRGLTRADFQKTRKKQLAALGQMRPNTPMTPSQKNKKFREAATKIAVLGMLARPAKGGGGGLFQKAALGALQSGSNTSSSPPEGKKRNKVLPQLALAQSPHNDAEDDDDDDEEDNDEDDGGGETRQRSSSSEGEAEEGHS